MNPTTSPVAWSLLARGAKGAKVYQILIFKNYAIVGWGSSGASKQYKVQTFPSPEAAKAFALEQTAKKEKGGYTMQRLPMVSPETPETLDWLSAYHDHRGQSSRLSALFNGTFLRGTPLGS